jgi:hypothetical protein
VCAVHACAARGAQLPPARAPPPRQTMTTRALFGARRATLVCAPLALPHARAAGLRAACEACWRCGAQKQRRTLRRALPPRTDALPPSTPAAAAAAAASLPCTRRPGALPRTARVGVLGGGQLGRMLAIAAVRTASHASPLRKHARGGLPPFLSPFACAPHA